MTATLNNDDAAAGPLDSAVRARPRRTVYVAPILIFVVVAIFLGIGLTLDPRKIPSPLIGKPVPQFDLPPVQGRTLGLATTNLRGEVSLVNVFAS